MRRLLALAVLLGIAFTTARADDRSGLEKQLREEYKDKVVILRHFCSGSDLRFDASGNKLKGGDPTSWTTDAEIKVADIHLKSDKLEIKGRRLLLLIRDEKTFEDFGAIDEHSVRITVELRSAAPTEDSIRDAWKSVFLLPGESLGDFAPSFWRPFFPSKEPGSSASSVLPFNERVQGQVLKLDPKVVSPPKPVSTPDPAYPELARSLKVQGTVVLYLVVDTEGRPRNIVLARAIGLGLDEKAVEAVSRWRFKPALKDGKPVAVAVNVEVNFHLY